VHCPSLVISALCFAVAAGQTQVDLSQIRGGSTSSPGVPACNASSADSGVSFTCTVPGVTSYSQTLVLLFTPSTTSGNTPTLNVNGLGPIPILRSDLNGVTAGELPAGLSLFLSFDGTAFRAMSENLEDDGSGLVINRAVFPHTIGVAPGVFGVLNGSNVWPGRNDFSPGVVVFPPGTAGVAGSQFSARVVNLTNAEILCPPSPTVLASVTIPAGTLAVGDVVDVEASDWAPNGDVTFATQVAFGNGTAPDGGFGLLGWAQKGHNYHYRYLVLGQSDIRTTGSATGGANVTWNASYDWVGPVTSPLASDIIVSLQTQAGSCSGTTEFVQYNFVIVRVE
jgi:hypothetical protein